MPLDVLSNCHRRGGEASPNPNPILFCIRRRPSKMSNTFDPTDPPMDIEAYDDAIRFTFSYPPKISSNLGGQWGLEKLRNFILPMTELRIIIVFLVTQILHFLLRRFGFTRITSEILAGFMLTIYAMNGDYQTFVEEALSVISKFNYIFFLFLMGVKLDITSIRGTDRKIWFFGSAIVLVPLGLAGVTASHLKSMYTSFKEVDLLALLNLSAIQSMSPFAVVVCLVSELRIINSEIGKLALSVATVSDLFSMFSYFTTSSIAKHIQYGHEYYEPFLQVVYIIASIALLVLVIRPVSLWVIKSTPEGSPVNEHFMFILVALAFGSTGCFYLAGFNMYMAPYLLGLAIPSGPPLGSTLEAKYNSFIVHSFLPFFVSFCAANANFQSIDLDQKLWRSAAIILLLIVVAKFVVALIFSLYCGLPSRDALVLSLILSSKGVVEIAYLTSDWELNVLPNRMLGIGFAFILGTSAVVPILVRNLYHPSRKYVGFKKRNLVDLEPNAELPILSCIYVRENISPMLKLVDACAVNEGRSMVVNALHLLRLTGQSNPVFISHGLSIKSISSFSKSKDVILSFKEVARKNPSISSLNIFTAISPPYSMSEDICTLALDRHASIIILPFHRVWTMDGHEVDDNSARALNRSLLQRAPCSVGILVDRGHIGRPVSHTSLLNMAMIFLGGKDDREALTLAKRMAEKPGSTLDVIRINTNVDEWNINWECMLDLEVLKDVRAGTCGKNVTYKEIRVETGNDLIEEIRNVVGAYRLVIVGRRNNENTRCTEGLEVWSDFPELGVIGDLLTSGEFGGDYSVLVVKQQVRIGSK